MAQLPSFNGFSLNDDNFITERIVFKGFASRSVIRATINRREGVKVLANEFGEKQISVEGRVVADTAAELQSLLDNLKKQFQAQDAELVLEADRTFKATTLSLMVPDEHYSQTTAPYEITFLCSNPFAEGSAISQSYTITSGFFTFSGEIYISGTMYGRPTVTYTPAGAASGNTLIGQLVINHVPTGQSITVSGFGSGQGLNYSNAVSVNFETFEAQEGTTEIDSSGAFPKWEPGANRFTVTGNRRFPGGTILVTYKPRYI